MPLNINDLMYAYFGGSPSLPDAAYNFYNTAKAQGVTGVTALSTPARFYTPTAALAETVPRINGQGNSGLLATGTLFMQAIILPAGITVNSITFFSATTAAGTPTHQWFALFDSSRNKLGVTVDDTTTAWAANSAKTLAMSVAYPVTTTGLYYIGILVTATTVPTLAGLGTGAAIGPVIDALPPVVQGSSSTGLTTPATCPNTAAALTPGAGHPYAYVS